MDTPWRVEHRDVATEIEKLSILIESTTNNVITFGIYRSVLERESAIRMLKEKITLPIVEFTLSKEQKNPLRLLASLGNSERKCVLFYEADEAFPEFLGYVNFQRERFADFSHAIIFWVNEPTLREIGTKAPDFWSWRRGVFDFRAELIERTQEFLQFVTREDFTYQNPGDIERRISLYEGLLKEHIASSKPDELFIADLENKLAQAYKLVARLNEAEKFALSALERGHRLQNGFTEINALIALGQISMNKATFTKAQQYLNEATKAIETDSTISVGSKMLFNAEIFNVFGMILLEQDEDRKAIEYFEKALQIFLKIFGDDNPLVATEYNNIGIAYERLGNLVNAIEYFEKTNKIYIKNYGENHPNLATSYNNLGNAYHSIGNIKQAITYYTKATEIILNSYGENHPNVATSYNNIGSAFYSLGNIEKAIEYAMKAIKIYKQLFGADHPRTKKAMENLEVAKGGK